MMYSNTVSQIDVNRFVY